MKSQHIRLRLGIDVGSTTTKLAVVDASTNEALHTCYCRHNAKQAETTHKLLVQAAKLFPDGLFRAAVCGSGGRPIAETLGVNYIQEVIANAAAVRALYPQARTAIELGGQDAKIVFFGAAQSSGRLTVSDMRMNGSCAGGTGAFIDEIAALLNVKTEEFEHLASKGKKVYKISGRCGVFAKTDIQPLLIQGAAHEDIALSTFHAIAKQTIGGLSQGLDFTPPIVFEGGPLTFNPTLVRVFAERLALGDDDIIIPEHAESVIAQGTAIALDELFPPENEKMLTLLELSEILKKNNTAPMSQTAKPFFASTEERNAFIKRQEKQILKPKRPHTIDIKDQTPSHTLSNAKYDPPSTTVNGQRSTVNCPPLGSAANYPIPTDNLPSQAAYIGIDSGSSTSKIVLIDENEEVIDMFYANNNGKSLQIVKDGLISLRDNFMERGIKLEVLGLGTTGYGELLFAKAFGADYHTVETVAHAQSCMKYAPDADFLLDIGGQDMKAIWMKDGVITNITLNEACSSGCGSFIENFALSLGIPVDGVAEAAFDSRNPASLGSRCTVFMNSTIVNEQRNGKQQNDIMAGLCRAMIENVFTKVIRVTNAEELGKKIVVQGGTFRNAAVLRAIEEYLGKEVTLAPYPGEMGAIGAALFAKRHIEEYGYDSGGCSSFIGFDAVSNLDYSMEEKVQCPLCANNCARTVVSFNTGTQYITGNRCERGASVLALDGKGGAMEAVPDMFRLRNELLFADYECVAVSSDRETIIGLPRVLEFWDSMPFWSTFFRALGYKIKFSHPSSQDLFEDGLAYIASDTVCFPAKLVHGHIHDLAKQGVDRIFMPYMMNMPTEGADEKAHQVCPVIKGYALVISNSDAPQQRYGVQFDTPVFHWYTENDKKRQVSSFAAGTLGATIKEAKAAYVQADAALTAFRSKLVAEGAKALEAVREKRGFAVVLAGRPYHTDSRISHDIPSLFTKKGIPVFCMDSLPGLDAVSLRHTRAELTNTHHARMLRSAVKAATEPELEFAQIVSFGCGHDAILSDEVIRVMGEHGGKPPLVLKVDEGEAPGSLRIRVQSFIETVLLRRKRETQNNPCGLLPDAYQTKFRKEDKKLRTLLLPNLSAPASRLLAAVLRKEGYIPKTVPLGGSEQIKVGKKHTHNDICFPCQVVIGELLAELQNGGYSHDEVAVCMMKLNCECRLAQYPALLRKALDNAGYGDVPIITNDLRDMKKLHPGFSPFGLTALIRAVWGFLMLDILEELRRKIRPYELVNGQTDRVFKQFLEILTNEMQYGLSKVKQVFKDAIEAFSGIKYDRTVLKPRVLVVGEFLVTAHPGSNFAIEEYLELGGMETIFPRITDQVRKEFLTPIWEKKHFKVKKSPLPFALDKLFDMAHKSVEKIAVLHPLYCKAPRPRDIYEGISHLIPRTLNCGEGWLMAAEIAHHAAQGVQSVVILQPFGCLPNHICGRGMTKRLKEDFPDVHFLPLDFDPDTGYANIENRLQMQIMNIRQQSLR